MTRRDLAEAAGELTLIVARAEYLERTIGYLLTRRLLSSDDRAELRQLGRDADALKRRLVHLRGRLSQRAIARESLNGEQINQGDPI